MFDTSSCEGVKCGRKEFPLVVMLHGGNQVVLALKVRMFLLFFSEPIDNGMWKIWLACNCVLISYKIHSSYLEKLIIVLLHLHVTDGTWQWKGGTSGRWIKQKQNRFRTGVGGWTLTSQPISRLGTVLRVPVNVQEGNRLKKYTYKTIIFTLNLRSICSENRESICRWTKASHSNNLTWLKVGLLCNLEQRSPCLQAPILK